MDPIAELLWNILYYYGWIVVLAVITSWLIAFNVINTHNNFVRSALRVLWALTEPVFRPIRKIIPSIGGIDFSPLVVFVIVWFLQKSVEWASLHGYI